MVSGALERRASPENPNTNLANPAEWLYTALGAEKAASGIRVSPEKALEWSAISAGIRMITGLIASLPFKVFERLEPGRRVARSHSVHRIISEEPNPEMTAFELWEMLTAHIPMFGVAYAEKVFDAGGTLRHLWPIHPDRVRQERAEDDRLIYRVRLPKRFGRDDRAAEVVLEGDQMLRIPGFATEGLLGKSLPKLHKEAIGLGIATERFAGKFFRRGASPSGVLETDSKLSDEAWKRLRDSGKIIYEGLDNAHRIAILEEGLKWQQVTVDPEKSQLLEGRKFQVREAARITKLPPYLLGDLSEANYNNIEQQNRALLTFTLNPWLRRIQNRVQVSLFEDSDRGRFFAEHVVEELLRPEAQARAELYQTRFQTASITPNRILEIENENPVEGGDEPFVPVNMIPLRQALELSPEERAHLLAAQQGASPASPELESRAGEESRQQEGATDPGATDERIRLVESLGPVFLEEFRRLVRGETEDVEELVREHLDEGQVSRFMRELDAYYGRGGRLPAFARERLETAFGALAMAVARAAGESVGEVPLEEASERFVQKYSDKFGDRYAADGRKTLMARVNEARESREDPATAVRGEITGWREGTEKGRPRAERWARDEANQLDNAVAAFTFAAAGVAELVWDAVGESCPICSRLDGTVVRTGKTFVGEGEQVMGTDGETTITMNSPVAHPPAHGGCDCRVVPKL